MNTKIILILSISLVLLSCSYRTQVYKNNESNLRLYNKEGRFVLNRRIGAQDKSEELKGQYEIRNDTLKLCVTQTREIKNITNIYSYKVIIDNDSQTFEIIGDLIIGCKW